MRVIRHDTVNWTPAADPKAVPMETAAKALFGKGGSAEAARQRMLERNGLVGDDSACAEDARQRMIERRERRGQ